MILESHVIVALGSALIGSVSTYVVARVNKAPDVATAVATATRNTFEMLSQALERQSRQIEEQTRKIEEQSARIAELEDTVIDLEAYVVDLTSALREKGHAPPERRRRRPLSP